MPMQHERIKTCIQCGKTYRTSHGDALTIGELNKMKQTSLNHSLAGEFCSKKCKEKFNLK